MLSAQSITSRDEIATVRKLWLDGLGVEDIAVALFTRADARTVEAVRLLIRDRAEAWRGA